ncbi:unnamed protein product [Effrenium voratum]|uniref:Uncharacterized protein n=1 Tax=Effrenium voratum TaxID=2562239 RepID=A0AA36JKI9_9DINO|nr:unnamed protein product [Effrenium voratum]
MAEAKSAGPPTPEQFKELLTSVPAARDQEARLALLLRAYRDTFASLQEEWEASGRQPELEDRF